MQSDIITKWFIKVMVWSNELWDWFWVYASLVA